jgi:Lon protease-like protein
MSAVASSGPRAASGLPQQLSIFPLPGVVLLPQARLPLNIFEPRYLAMIEESLGAGRMIGIIQPTAPETSLNVLPALYRMGCAGRITSFTETDDGRFLLALTGICRFTVLEEFVSDYPWRRIRPDWSPFAGDLHPSLTSVIDRQRLLQALHPYFREEGIRFDTTIMDNAPDDVLVSSLVMICPFEPSEKQALLEAADLSARAQLLIALLEMACVPGHRDRESGAKH